MHCFQPRRPILSLAFPRLRPTRASARARLPRPPLRAIPSSARRDGARRARPLAPRAASPRAFARAPVAPRALARLLLVDPISARVGGGGLPRRLPPPAPPPPLARGARRVPRVRVAGRGVLRGARGPRARPGSPRRHLLPQGVRPSDARVSRRVRLLHLRRRPRGLRARVHDRGRGGRGRRARARRGRDRVPVHPRRPPGGALRSRDARARRARVRIHRRLPRALRRGRHATHGAHPALQRGRPDQTRARAAQTSLREPGADAGVHRRAPDGDGLRPRGRRVRPRGRRV